MKLRLIGAHIAVVGGALVALAATIFLILQWGNSCDYSLFGKNTDAPTAVVMFAAAVFGWLCPYLAKLLWRNWALIRRYRRTTDAAREAVRGEVASQLATADDEKQKK
ncbi:MAG: hypothetical protein ACYS8X_01500 [Planctomycetota bacterium]